MRKVIAMLSGGKDSNFALHWAVTRGFEVTPLIIKSKAESLLFHVPYSELAILQAKAMNLDYLFYEIGEDEESELKEIFHDVRRRGFEGVISGALLSDYQRQRYSYYAFSAGLNSVAPLWKIDQRKYMFMLVKSGFEFIIIKASAYGFPLELVGKVITEEDVKKIVEKAKRYGFNPAFEGGEAETLVLWAPLYKRRLCVEGKKKRLSEYEAVYEILNAWLC